MFRGPEARSSSDFELSEAPKHAQAVISRGPEARSSSDFERSEAPKHAEAVISRAQWHVDRRLQRCCTSIFEVPRGMMVSPIKLPGRVLVCVLL